jgi:S1-C subfamily serine protease
LVGDILLSVDGESFNGLRELAALLSTRGEAKAKLGLLRGGRREEIELEIGLG